MNISHSKNKESKNREKIDILLVDDNPTNLNLLSTMLNGSGYRTRRAIGGQMALQAVKANQFDLILLDASMPQMDGYEVCYQLKANPQTANIPVIFISARNEVLDKIKAFDAGGVDYISKPFEIEEVKIRISNQINILKLHKENRQINLQLKKKIEKQDRELKTMGKKLAQSQQNLLIKTLEDPITHLANRYTLLGKLRQTCKVMFQNESDFSFTLVVLKCYSPEIYSNFIDFQLADNIAIAIAERLSQHAPSPSILSRLEGNEFVVVLNKISDLEQSKKVAENLANHLSLPFVFKDSPEFLFQVDYGLVLIDKNNHNPELMLRKARKLAFEKGKKYRDRQIQKAKMNQNTSSPLDIDKELRQAWECQELNLLYQPIISLNRGLLHGGDVFVSWLDRGVKNIISSQLFAAIQDEKLSLGILKWLLKQACQDFKKWQEIILWTDESKYVADDNIGINFRLFGQQLFLPKLSESLDEIVRKTGVSSQSISLEVAATLMHDNFALMDEKIKELKSLGFRITIDDLNIGQFTPDRYRNFDNLKIYVPSISRSNQSDRQWANVTKKITLARDAKITITAVDVKKSEQLKLMRQSRCEFVQGSLIYKPVSRKTIETLIVKNPWYGTKDFKK